MGVNRLIQIDGIYRMQIPRTVYGQSYISRDTFDDWYDIQEDSLVKVRLVIPSRFAFSVSSVHYLNFYISDTIRFKGRYYSNMHVDLDSLDGRILFSPSVLIPVIPKHDVYLYFEHMGDGIKISRRRCVKVAVRISDSVFYEKEWELV